MEPSDAEIEALVQALDAERQARIDGRLDPDAVGTRGRVAPSWRRVRSATMRGFAAVRDDVRFCEASPRMVSSFSS